MSNVHTITEYQSLSTGGQKYVTEETHNRVINVQRKYIIEEHNRSLKKDEKIIELTESNMEKDFIIEDLAKGDKSTMIEIVTGGDDQVEDFVKKLISAKIKSLDISKEREAEIRIRAAEKSAAILKEMARIKIKK